MCRSRRELSNEHLLDEIGVDTAENEPRGVWGKIQFNIHSPPPPPVVPGPGRSSSTVIRMRRRKRSCSNEVAERRICQNPPFLIDFTDRIRVEIPSRLRIFKKPNRRPIHGQTLEGSFSAVSKPNFARKYAFESSRRDLHNALLCTALQSHFFAKI